MDTSTVSPLEILLWGLLFGTMISATIVALCSRTNDIVARESRLAVAWLFVVAGFELLTLSFFGFYAHNIFEGIVEALISVFLIVIGVVGLVNLESEKKPAEKPKDPTA